MLNKLRSNKGFTLIELLIVVAIIGILAAIAIPQFSKYRIQGFNASGNSDLKNIRTSQESLYAEWQHYGLTQGLATVAGLPGAGKWGVGALVTPTAALPVCIITTDDNNLVPRGLQIPVGNNVTAMATTAAAGAGDGGSYTLAAKHLQGDVIFAADSDSTANYKMTFAAPATGLNAGYPLTAAFVPVSVNNVDDYQALPNWVKM
ncbi:type IV pilin protein [Geotalea uraniireducens]|uniref:Prepilin-type N-terminal cleavage/methylation domain-containing protein n=1 Tax=Geotalea uraniireducens (strain Rf4) TaxID=351605 RepID=A5G4Y3_GEOUR|nr:prepilin-type N-terminal cleavage/methylation domain-containing protein [Geotalea uraniireducens]ABQ26851.1 hypothetical protein Gura_2677 [Geotalea uraniireducens Rf4]